MNAVSYQVFFNKSCNPPNGRRPIPAVSGNCVGGKIRRIGRLVRTPRPPRPGERNQRGPASRLPWAAYNRARYHLCQKRIRCKSLFLKSPPALFLASTSSYRRELLARVHNSFQCAAPQVDETRLGQEGGVALVGRL